MRLAKILSILAFCWSLELIACTEDSSLRIFSYNIHRSSWYELSKYWSSRRAAVLNVIRENPADVYLFQEIGQEEEDAVAEVLPDFRSVRQSSHLVMFYRAGDWRLIQNNRWRDSETMQAGRVILQSLNRPKLPFVDIWNIWLNETIMNEKNESYWSLADILRGSSRAPSLVSVSLRARDELQHDRRLYDRLLQRLSLKQAAPELYRVTTNGWWAEKRLTADWHDAVLVQKEWTQLSAHIIKTQSQGTFPSTHYPLLTSYCPAEVKDNLMAGESL